MNSDQHVTGVASDPANRSKTDFYATPDWATEALLEKERFHGLVWEPACGDGAMSKVLIRHGLNVRSSDLFDYGYGDTGVDFLKSWKRVSHVITNPPYKLAQQFTEHALRQTSDKGGKVALLLRLQYLEGQKREELFRSTPLKTVYVFSRRLSMSRDNAWSGAGGMMAFAWYVWDWQHTGPPTIDWIS